MEILLAFVFGAAVGLVAQYSMSGGDLRGVALPPMFGAVVGGAAWLALTWSGLGTDNAWIWLVSAVAPIVLVPTAVAVLTRSRRASDERARRSMGLI